MGLLGDLTSPLKKRYAVPNDNVNKMIQPGFFDDPLTAALARKHAVSEATIFNWKANFCGMDVSEDKRLKQLEDENAMLKKVLAKQTLDVAAIPELRSRNGKACRAVRSRSASSGRDSPVGTSGL